MATRKIRTAVITGEHEYDVTGFQSLFRSFPEIDAYPQNMGDFVLDPVGGRKGYEVLLFYNMHTRTPDEGDGAFEAAMKETLEGLSDGQNGIFLLHHALVAFPDWPLWGELSGMPKRSNVQGFTDRTVHVDVADAWHPITAGLEPWDIVDETYITEDADATSDILLTTDHPQSMKTIAWTRTLGKTRVFCYQSGHDAQAYVNPSFRAVVGRGIQWLGGRT